MTQEQNMIKLKEFIEKIGRRSLIIIISDFFDDTEKIIHQLRYFH